MRLRRSGPSATFSPRRLSSGSSTIAFAGIVEIIQDLRQERALELRRETVHVDRVEDTPADAERLAQAPELPEAGSPVGADAAFIGGDNAEHDVVQAHAVEAIVQHQPRRLGAVAAPPALLLTNYQAELRRPLE